MFLIKTPWCQAALWALTAIAIILTIGRYAVRQMLIGRFYSDDFTHLIALLALIGFAISTQCFVDLEVQELEIEAGQVPEPRDSAKLALHAKQYQVALSIFAWISLWFVKFTFLLFYRLLFNVSPIFMKAWWIVMVFVFVSFWIPIAGVLTACGPTSQVYNASKLDLLSSVRFSHVDRKYRGVRVRSSISTATPRVQLCVPGRDRFYECVNLPHLYRCLGLLETVMALPLWMLRSLAMRPIQKLGLVFIFGVALLTVALEILRTVESVKILKGAASIQSTTYARSILYAVIEIAFNVIISSLPVYRTLMSIKRRTGYSRSGRGSTSEAAGGWRLVSSLPKHSRHSLDTTRGSGSLPRPQQDFFAKYTSGQAGRTSRGVHEHYPTSASEKAFDETHLPFEGHLLRQLEAAHV